MPIVAFEDRIEIPSGLENLAAFRAWTLSEGFPDGPRIDYVGGRIEVAISPERINAHSLIKTELAAKIAQRAADLSLGQVFIDRTRVVSGPGDLSCEPDLCLVTWESLRGGRVRYTSPPKDASDDFLEIEGGPDLVVEIVSPSSIRKDTRVLPSAYFAAGVREYWLVNALEEEVRLTLHRRAARGFTPADPDSDGFLPSEVLSSACKLTVRPGPVAFTRVYSLALRPE